MMKIVRSPIRLLLKAGILEYLASVPSVSARLVEFDYIKQEVEITRGKLHWEKKKHPFRSISKVYHRIYGDVNHFDSSFEGTGAPGGISSLSIIFLDIKNHSNETIFMEFFGEGGNSKRLRSDISRVQEIVDVICKITDKPMVIECEEIGFYVDMDSRRILFAGRALSLSEVALIQVVETKEGYYSVEIFTKEGELIVTTKGRDKTLFISDTVKLVAERAGLPFQRAAHRETLYDPRPPLPLPGAHKKTYIRKAFNYLRGNRKGSSMIGNQ